MPCGDYTDQTCPNCCCVALDVVGFSQFKRHYETQMEERASEQLCRITKEEFLTAIVEPYRMAFTQENIKKSYETTGTWPVNRLKITADKIAPAEGLSHYSSPIVAPSSPVKAVKTLLYNILSEETPSDGDTAVQHNSSTPAPAGSALPQSLLSSSFIHDLSKTRAAFLLKSTHPSSTTTVPPLEHHPALDLVPHTSLLSTKPLNPQTLSKGVLVETVGSLQQTIDGLKRQNAMKDDQILTLFAQLTLKDMELTTRRKADHNQEKRGPQSARKQLFPGGRGQVVTSDGFMDTLANIEAERVAKVAQKTQMKEEKAALHALWEAAKRKWQKRRENLKSRGLKMELAGPKPRLKDMKLLGGQHPQFLAQTPPPTSPIVEVEPHTHHRTSLDSVREDFLVWDSEQSDTESEGYLLYNDSDENM